VTVPGGAGYFNSSLLLASIPWVQRASMTEFPIAGTNHILTWGNAREIFFEATERWVVHLGIRFAGRAAADPAALPILPSLPSGGKRESRTELPEILPLDRTSPGRATLHTR
jgi:hypothetical protein